MNILYVTDCKGIDYPIDLDKPCDIICDIDGTIADNSHRTHFIQEHPKNWKAFNAGYLDDEPISDILDKLRLLYIYDFRIIYLSGREKTYSGFNLTELWLTWFAPYGKLYMRPEGDYRCDSTVKYELYQKVIQDGFEPKYVFDDRNKVVNMWKEKTDLTVIQTAEGDF